MEVFSVKNADFITTVSRRNEKRAKQMGKKVLYIPHGYFEGIFLEILHGFLWQ